MTDNDKSFIEALLKIANSKQVKELCEPHIMWHEDIKENLILRVLYSMKLLEDTMDNFKTG